MLDSAQQRKLVLETITEVGSNTGELSRLFYRELFRRDAHLRTLFSGNVISLNRKFINMFATFSQVEHLEKISASVERIGERHLQQYGALIRHFNLFEASLIEALALHLKGRFTPEREQAWRHVFGEVSAIMMRFSSQASLLPASVSQTLSVSSSEVPQDFLQRIGGPAGVMKVHQRFYDVLFADPWLGQFFYGKHESVLATKQTQFMVAAFGGCNEYTGDTPAFVHMHMYITADAADRREQILHEAILSEGVSCEDAVIWLAVDRSFRPAIVKADISECVMKCRGQIPIRAKKPENYPGGATLSRDSG